MGNNETKNDQAWSRIFIDFRVLERIKSKGQYRISASQIKNYREPRLMTKFDHQSNLPQLFKQNNLSILPITRGDYIIAPMEVYNAIDYSKMGQIIYCALPDHLHTLDYNNIYSEAIAINCAYVSGILDHFIGEELLPTVNGRMSSDNFSFSVNSKIIDTGIRVEVNNSQIEIDGGFEGLNSFVLIEAKNSISDDFLIRQLYYPMRLWSEKIRKPVRLIFMIYTNGIFHLFEYQFRDKNLLNSLILVQSKRYSLEKRGIELEEVSSILQKTKILPEPEVPFPQADSFDRLINLCELLHKNDLSKDQITTTYDFDRRQTDYYSNAGKYLGLIDDSEQIESGCQLTEKGKGLFNLNIRERQLKIIEIILEHSVFVDALSLYFEKAVEPDRNEIVKIMRKSELYNIGSLSTYHRRASTILCWIRWILDLIQVQ